MEISRVILQILRGRRREVDRKPRELDVTGPVVLEAQISVAATRMLTIDGIRASTLANWQVSVQSVSRCRRVASSSGLAHMALSRPLLAVVSLPFPLIHKLDSVKVSHMTASDEAERPATTETWPAMFLPKSRVTAEGAEKTTVSLAPFNNPRALSTVPLTL